MVRIPVEERDFSPLQNVQTEYWGSLQWVKRPGRDVDHSTPTSAEIRMSGTVLLLLLYAFMAGTRTTFINICRANLHISEDLSKLIDSFLKVTMFLAVRYQQLHYTSNYVQWCTNMW
jgi:hypothetical protein